MISQTITSLPPNHVHLKMETCPACGQEIPPDKLEEISGRIAAREHEHTLAITTQLERQHALEKSQAEAKAKADLEAERQQSTLREARARTEAQKAAEKKAAEVLAAANLNREQAEADLKQKLEAAEEARRLTEEQGAGLQAQLAAAAAALETEKEQGRVRETQICDDAQKAAESFVAERIAKMEETQRENEASLQARIDAADASKAASEQREFQLQSQLRASETTHQAEIEKVKQEAERDAERIRSEATAAAEKSLREKVAAHEKSAFDANNKAREAEAKVKLLEEQHASTLEKELNAQREVMEQAAEAKLNAQSAKSFDETLKLTNKVNELQRALEKKTADELGEGAEVDVYEALKAEFPDDKINRIPKGSAGADIRQIVTLHGKECGTILYDSKNHNQFRTDHVSKLRSDQIAAKAEHAILSTRKFPQGTGQLHIQDGVILVNPARVISIATIVRQHLLQVHTMRLSGIERDKKTTALYEFITSEHCASLLTRVDDQAADLLELQTKEVKWHQAHWNKEGETLRAIQKAKGDLTQCIGSIIGTFGNETDIEEVS